MTGFYRGAVGKKQKKKSVRTPTNAPTSVALDVRAPQSKFVVSRVPDENVGSRRYPTVGICGRVLTRHRRFEADRQQETEVDGSVNDTRTPSQCAEFVVRSRRDRANAHGAVVISRQTPHDIIVPHMTLSCAMCIINNKYVNVYRVDFPTREFFFKNVVSC